MAKLPSLDSEIALYKKQSVSTLSKSLGAPRDYFQGQYERNEARLDTVDPQDYRKMWQNDGQVAAIVMLPRLMLLGAGYDIVADDDAQEELEFVKNNLLTTSANGGIKTSLDSVIEDMTYAPFEGARYYELVYRLEGGKILLDRIASRDNLICYPLADDNGYFAGFMQRAIFFGKTKEVLIPNEKAVAVIFNEAYGGLRGLPLLKAAWYHWDKKHKLYFIAHLASELQTIPPKILSVKDLDQATKSAIEAGIDNLGLQARITIPEGNATIEELGNKGAPTVGIQDLIDHHNSQISKSLLAHHIDLGTAGSGGSRALGTAQIDLYLDFLRGLRKKIENSFNDVIIPRLVDYNFNTKKYPRLIINDLADKNKELILETFKVLVDKGELPNSTKMSVIKKVADEVGIEFDEKEMEVQLEKEEVKQDSQQEVVINEELDNVELADVTEQRSLTEDEKRVDFTSISSKIDRLSNDLYTELSALIAGNKDEVLAQIDTILSSGQVSLLSDLQVANRNEIIVVIEKYLNQMYDFSKVKAADEIGVGAPKTDSQQKSLLVIAASNAAAKLIEDLKNGIINIVRTDITNGVDSATTKVTVSNEIDNYSQERLKIIGEQNIINTMDQARRYTFKENEGEIVVAYRYSAVLDSRTTQYCRSLDGKVFMVGSKELAKATPPIHFRCRSMLVAIKKEDKISDVVTQDIRSFPTLAGFKNMPAFFSEEKEKQIEESAAKVLSEGFTSSFDETILKLLNNEE